ncbi:hypothetical protein ACFW04_008284 [Cataglyphis niger]
MISNITLMYIHLRLTEIFNTMDYLLQLPPVHKDSSFIELSKLKIEKYIGAMGFVNLWSLFSYDELQINVRQQGDNSYRDILKRIRIGTVTNSAIIILKTRKITFREINCDGRLQELCNYLQSLPMDTVCLFPTYALCDILNTALLNRISSDKIVLVAQDLAEILNKNDEDSSRTAGLARIITVKLGARVILRRNIDVSLGLVNGMIGTISSIMRNAINNDVKKIKKTISSKIEHIIERLSIKFEVMDRTSLEILYSIVDKYMSLFYVATLSGLHLINFDPFSIKANKLALIEYNKLRTQYRPDLLNIFNILKQRFRKVRVTTSAVLKNVLECQLDDKNINDYTLWNVRGLPNVDNISFYVNRTNIIKKFIDCYVSKDKNINIMPIRQLAGHQYLENIQQDISEFIIHFINNIDNIKSIFETSLSGVR